MNSDSRSRHGVCVVIPAFREEKSIGKVVKEACSHDVDVIVVDDGSDDATAGEAEKAGAVVIRHTRNAGKGVALNSGFSYAREQGYKAVITMDGDGQHDPAEIPSFIETFERTGIPVLVGNRMANADDMPFVRKCTNRFMSWMLSRMMGEYVPDTQCGYRLYRCDVIPFVSARSERFAAESEILLHVASRGIRIGAVRISTIYGDEQSKINPLADAARFVSMMIRYRREFRK